MNNLKLPVHSLSHECLCINLLFRMGEEANTAPVMQLLTSPGLLARHVLRNLHCMEPAPDANKNGSLIQISLEQVSQTC